MTRQSKPSDVLEVEVKRLALELRIVKERLHEARIAESGVVIGDVVISTGRRRRGQRFRVTEIDTRHSGPPWLRGNPTRADGAWSKAQLHLYDDWELVE